MEPTPDTTPVSTPTPGSIPPATDIESQKDSAGSPLDPDFRDAIASCASVLGALFLNDPRTEEAQNIVSALADLDLATEWPLGHELELAHAQDLIAAGVGTSIEERASEYKRQFVGPGHFEAPAWGSVYLDKDQVVFGTSELELHQWMRTNGIESHEEHREPTDHIGKMLALLGWLARERPTLVGSFLGEHLMPWAPRYFDLLEASAHHPLYQGLAVLSRTTLTCTVEELGVHVASKQLFF